MWVRKKEWDTLKEKVAALEEEQLQLRKRIKENLVCDEQVLGEIKDFRNEMKNLLEI